MPKQATRMQNWYLLRKMLYILLLRMLLPSFKDLICFLWQRHIRDCVSATERQNNEWKLLESVW